MDIIDALLLAVFGCIAVTFVAMGIRVYKMSDAEYARQQLENSVEKEKKRQLKEAFKFLKNKKQGEK